MVCAERRCAERPHSDHQGVRRMVRSSRARAVALTAALAMVTSGAASSMAAQAHGRSASSQVRISWVTIGDAGNPPDHTVMVSDRTMDYGSVPYAYRIGKYDVTNKQYVAFLNAVASKFDPHLLFFPCMDRTACYHEGSGIARTGGPGGFHYAVEPGRARMPVN